MFFHSYDDISLVAAVVVGGNSLETLDARKDTGARPVPPTRAGGVVVAGMRKGGRRRRRPSGSEDGDGNDDEESLRRRRAAAEGKAPSSVL